MNNKQNFANNLQYYMNLNKVSRFKLSKDIDVPYTTISNWLKTTNYPREEKLTILAKYFDVEIADLVDNNYLEKVNSKVQNVVVLNDKTLPVYTIKLLLPTNDKYFGYYIRNDSLIGKNIAKDDLLVFKRTKEIIENKIMFIEYDKTSIIAKISTLESHLLVEWYNYNKKPLLIPKTSKIYVLGVLDKIIRNF